MNRKAQITLFAIIGVVLLLVIGLMLFLSKPKDISPEEEISESTILTPIEAHVKNCISEIGKDGIIKLGMHGGYIDPEEFGIVPNSALPTYANGISLFEDSETLPYWFYLKSSNPCKQNCIVSSEQPPINAKDGVRSMESQLASYVEENIGFCMNNFSALEKTGISAVIDGAPDVDAYIKDESVSFFLKQKIIATYEGKEMKYEKFQASIPVGLKRNYELMSRLVDFARSPSTRFFETKTMHIVGTYAMGKDAELPPIGGGIGFGSDNTGPWQVTTVAKKIQAILEDHVPLFTVDQTRNSYVLITPDPIFNGIYMDFIIDVPGLSNPEDYTIDFVYLQDWPIYVDVNPSKGGLITPEEKTLKPLLPITMYVKDFSYDISYPIIIVVRDEEAFDGEGFIFQTAMEINIRGNLPLNITGSMPGAGTGITSSMFCDYDQKKSDQIQVKVQDSKGSPLVDASILYECGDESCFIGKTGPGGTLTDRLPACINGVLNAEVDDYLAKPERLTVQQGTKASLTITAEPYLDTTVTIKKMRLSKVNSELWVLDGASTTELSHDDKAVIVMNRKPGIGESEYAQTAQINGKIDPVQATMRLVPGEYDLTILLMTNLGKDSESKKIISIPLDDEEPLVLDTMFSSGELIFDSTTSGAYNLTSSNLQQGKMTLIVPYVDSADIVSVEDMSIYYEYLTNLSKYSRQDLLPRFN